MDKRFYNEEYEKAILGIMLNDNSVIDMIKSRLVSSAFVNPKCKFIYENIIADWDTNHCCNILTLSSRLNNMNPADIAALTDSVSTSSNWEFYVDKVSQLYTARTMKVELGELLNNISADNVGDYISEFNSKLAGYMQSAGNKGVDIQNLCMEIPKQMEEASKRESLYKGMECGWSQIDDITDGFQTKKMYVIGARPSIGKTAFATGLLSNFCRKGIKSAIFSLEMSAESLFYRMLSVESKISIWQLTHGECIKYQDGLRKLQIGLTNLYKFPLNIMDTDVDQEENLYARIRYEAKVNGTKIVMIDHLGLIESKDKSVQRYEQVGRITKTLHKMAKELDICVILLCQMGRGAEGKKPNMSLLRESGNIEQDADVIMFLHRERDMNEKQIPTEVIIEKNRDGKIGTANMLFLTDYTKFVEDPNSVNKEVA